MPGKETEVVYGDRNFDLYGESDTYPYTNILEMAENVYEPEQIPVLKFNNESKYNLIFKGWRLGNWDNNGRGIIGNSFPSKGYWRGGASTYNIDGKTAYSVPLYAVFELIPTATITAKFKLDEKSDTVYATLVSQPGDEYYRKFDVPKAPEKEGYIFAGWYYFDEDGERRTFYGQYSNTFYSDVTIYADWMIYIGENTQGKWYKYNQTVNIPLGATDDVAFSEGKTLNDASLYVYYESGEGLKVAIQAETKENVDVFGGAISQEVAIITGAVYSFDVAKFDNKKWAALVALSEIEECDEPEVSANPDKCLILGGDTAEDTKVQWKRVLKNVILEKLLGE